MFFSFHDLSIAQLKIKSTIYLKHLNIFFDKKSEKNLKFSTLLKPAWLSQKWLNLCPELPPVRERGKLKPIILSIILDNFIILSLSKTKRAREHTYPFYIWEAPTGLPEISFWPPPSGGSYMDKFPCTRAPVGRP